MTQEARWNAELQMKTRVVDMGNVWLRSDVSDGVLTAAQYKTVVQGVARDLASSAWVNHPWDGTLYAEVYLRLMQKKTEALKDCWGESTLKSAMRAIPAAGPTEALQHVFLRINREQVANERDCRAIVDEHVRSRRPHWLVKLRGADGELKREAVWRETRLMERCIADRKKALQLGRVIPAHMQNPITLAARANLVVVNEMMMREFEKRMTAWWEFHKYDDPEDDLDYDPTVEEHERFYNPHTKERDGERSPLDPLWIWRS